MKISELAQSAGVPLPTVKFYLRSGLLPAGRRTAATQADYGPEHLARLRLVRALVDTAQLSLAQVKEVLAAMGQDDLLQAVGAAQAALPPAGDPDVDLTPALELVERMGWSVAPDTPALRQLATSLASADEIGMQVAPRTLVTYARAAEKVAERDVAGVPTSSPEEAAAYVVVGTVLLEPVLLALRRLAQQSVATHAWGGSTLPP